MTHFTLVIHVAENQTLVVLQSQKVMLPVSVHIVPLGTIRETSSRSLAAFPWGTDLHSQNKVFGNIYLGGALTPSSNPFHTNHNPVSSFV